MQPLNNDMDELFRRAADEYPLNTGSEDWSKVQNKLRAAGEDESGENEKRNDYRFLWLLLLLPIGFMCGRYIGANDKAAPAVTHQVDQHNGSVTGKTVSGAKANPLNPTAVKQDTRQTAVDISKVTGASTVREGSSPVASPGRKAAGTTAGAIADSKVYSKGITAIEKTPGSGGPAASNAQAGTGRQRTTSKKGAEAVAGTGIIDNSAENAQAAAGSKNGDSMVQEKGLAEAAPTLPPVDASKDADADKIVDSKSGDSTMVNSMETTAKKTSIPGSKWYYSFVAGPDLSTVKLKKTSNLGYSFGVMVGYQFNKKWSVEGGALWDRKYYNATGEYLDTSRLQLPRHSMVSNLDGYCDMIEIPVNVKYNFIMGPGHSWFFSTGLSSYLMKKEDYNLSYHQYGTPYNKDYQYTNSSKDWFSILNLSMGYQKSVGKYTNITIAPYVKLPLRAVGIGKLPISSTGIYFSLSRSFH